MSRILFACFALGGLTPDPTPTDYCANSYCAPGLVNVGCNPPPLTGGPECAGKNPEVMEITSVEIDLILNKMNTLRQSYASGAHAPTFPIASSMPSLQWDAELASQAGNNVRSCRLRYDGCHNTAQFSNSGQISAIGIYDKSTLYTTSDTVNDMFLGIASEVNNYVNGADSYSSYRASNSAKRLAQVLNDRSSKVGCALQKFDTTDGFSFYNLICNFSANLIKGQPIYTQG